MSEKKLSEKKMSKIRRRSQKVGLPPETLVYVGKKRIEKSKITIVTYDEKHFEIRETEKVDDIITPEITPKITPEKKDLITWINIDGLHDTQIIEKVGIAFGIHPLLLEDVLNTDERPKVDETENYLFIILKDTIYDEAKEELDIEHVSLILGPNFLISLKESDRNIFSQVLESLKKGGDHLRERKADYLAYTLIDSIVDRYFLVLEKLGERIEELEIELVNNPTSKTLHQIHKVKRELLALRKILWPTREIVNLIERSQPNLIHESTHFYLRDVYDHIYEIIDTLETHREMASGMIDIYLSSISNRMNEIMKVLTIIATIFMPLTLIAGIYGMNFRYMPELNWRYGYPLVLAIMLIIGISMIITFRRRKWL